MKEILIEHFNKIKKCIPLIEKKLPVKLTYSGKKIMIKGEELNEFLAEEIVKAIDFGFDIDDVFLLLNPDFVLHFINIKDHTVKKNFTEIRSRVIGTNGRAKGTIQDLTGSIIVLHENQVGILVDSDHLDSVVQAITSLIRGSKHANIFAYLEKQNVLRRKLDDDLGLKNKKDEELL
jgi:KH domain-containing protein